MQNDIRLASQGYRCARDYCVQQQKMTDQSTRFTETDCFVHEACMVNKSDRDGIIFCAGRCISALLT